MKNSNKSVVDKKETQSYRASYAPLIHLSITGSLLFPFLFLIVPFLAYKFSSNPRVQAAGREVLNFCITMILIPFICVASLIFLVGTSLLSTAFAFGVSALILAIPYLFLSFIIFPIIGAMKAADGVDYRYPLTISFIK